MYRGIRLTTRTVAGMFLTLLLVFALPASGTAAERVKLKYGWEKGQQFAYQVKIDVTMENYSETLSGVSQYQVIKSDADSFTVKCTGRLSSATQSKSKRMLIPPMRIHRHRSPFAGLAHSMSGAFESHVLELNRFGEIDTVKGSSLLPYLIGHLSKINLIPLSPEGKSEWSESEKTTVSIISTDRIPLPFRDSNVEKTMGAKQTTEYKITGEKGDAVTIAVTHSYRTVGTVDGEPEIELSGTGTIEFDKKQGGVKSLLLNYKMFRRSETSVHKIPITISSKQLSEKELAKLRADQEELRKKHLAERKKREAASKFEIPENIDADLKEILTDLASKNILKRKAALKKLSQAKPKKDKQQVSQILICVLNSKDISVVADASEALVVWSTKDDIPAMIEVLSDVNILGLDNVAEAILKHKTPEGIEAVAKLMKDPVKGHRISTKLIAYGSGAEDAVLEQLDPSNFVVLVGVLRVLKEIGTEKTLKKIEEIKRTTDNRSFQFQTAATVKAIEARLDQTKS
ncbi:HEAT repeat domain-containing protein [Gimesia fumaroli]|uniref:HEAT repeat domain-containing protein n=1 Tax=Gimesia fumaroli TaxID=2527976 RepID=A0A518IAT0_9PLAN|nr:hypothetical protein [Gimesia fumaroli]QDV50223.1 hypothetical protein Enr17x_22610 [Gimesia fumaroli]